jgi:uncharacterized protein with GYD domain
MSKYLIQVNFTTEGLKGLQKEGGTGRVPAVKKLFESLGGKLEAFYYALGDTDVVIIAELPDNVSVTAGAIATIASGAARTRTTVLLTPEEVDRAVKMKPDYRPPGK